LAVGALMVVDAAVEQTIVASKPLMRRLSAIRNEPACDTGSIVFALQVY
jgi:hypothetical protein